MLLELLRYYSAVRDCPLLTSAQAPPFRPVPKRCILSCKATTIFCLPNFPSWLSSFLLQAVSSLQKLLPGLYCILRKLPFKLWKGSLTPFSRPWSQVKSSILLPSTVFEALLLCDIITALCHYVMASLCHYGIFELAWLRCQVVLWLLDCVPHYSHFLSTTVSLITWLFHYNTAPCC